MIVKQFHDPVFKAHVIFIVEGEPEEVSAYIKKRFPHEGDCSLRGFEGMCFRADKDEMKYYIVWMRYRDKYYTLTHEVIHMVEWIFRDINIKFESEQVCYYHEFWMRKLWKAVSQLPSTSPKDQNSSKKIISQKKKGVKG